MNLSNCQTTSSLNLYDISFKETSEYHHDSSFIKAWQDPESKQRLYSVITKGLLNYCPSAQKELLKEIEKLVQIECSDQKFVLELKRFFSKQKNIHKINQSVDTDEAARVERRVEQILKIFPTSSQPNRIMDIGCGNGRILSRLAERIGLKTEDAIGVDLHYRSEGLSNFTYLHSDNGKIPYPANSIELATALMTMHHEKQPQVIFNEAFRLLKPGALFLIREHDAASKSDRLFCHALDLLYLSLVGDIKGVPQPGNYLSIERWKDIAENCGFEIEGCFYPEPDSPIKPFYMILRKPPN